MKMHQLLHEELSTINAESTGDLQAYIEAATKGKGRDIRLRETEAVAHSIVLEHPGLVSASRRKEHEFYQRVAEVALDNGTMEELSTNVGLPRENESEDEFVKRAKSQLRRILLKRLSSQI